MFNGKLDKILSSDTNCTLLESLTLKPIFHQNAKYLASGVGVGQCTRCQNFALPNAKYTNMLVYFGVTPDANPRRQSVEYRWHWVFWRWSCIFHVYFMYISCIFHVVCASFSASATRELASFQWNMGLSSCVGASFIKAYIPLRRKTIRVGSWLWLGPPTPQLCITYTNILASKSAKICFTSNANPQRKSVE